MILTNTCQYIQTGSRFYRLGSRSVLDTFGTNLQNIEKSIRALYIPKEGYILNQRDQSGAEALIVAYLCRAGSFRDLFLYGIKAHVFVALHLFREVWQKKMNEDSLDIKFDVNELCATPIHLLKQNPWWKRLDTLIKSSDNWPPSQRYYYIAKQVCHSSNYGVRENAFILNTLEKSRGKIALKKKDASYFLEFYHSLFPEIREWHRLIEKQVRETRILYNLLGDPIQITDNLDTENSIKECFAAIPQSTVACITRQAIIKTQEYIEHNNKQWDILEDNHDSFLTQSPIDESIECHTIMKQYIEPELTNFNGEKFSMKSEGASGFNWAPFHTTKNPNGLKEVEI